VKIIKFGGLLPALLFGMFLIGCDRMATQSRSNIVIQMPSVEQMRKASSKADVSTLAAVDLQKLCFIINVKGPNIATTPAAACDVERGIFAGSVGPGQMLSVNVESGAERVFELYAYIRTTSTEVCKDVLPKGWNVSLDKTYFLGKVSGITITPPETTVDIPFTIPTDSQNILVQNSWPVSCLGNVSAAPARIGRVVTAANLQTTGLGYKIYSKVSPISDQNNLGTTGYKIRNWKVGE
jgi:hypothetical protein